MKKRKNPEPNTSYTLKYANIIGLDVGEAAAKITTPNQQFGMGKKKIFPFIIWKNTNYNVLNK